METVPDSGVKRKRRVPKFFHSVLRRRVASVVIGVALIGFGAYGLVGWWRATHHKQTVAAVSKALGTTVSNSTENPDETPIKKDNYSVAADMPRQILLPTIHASGYIQKVSVDQHNAVAVPNNVHIAGWFINSAKPGAPGLSIIDGHVQGKYSEGVFKNLSGLHSGDTIDVEYGDMSLRHFEIVQVKTMSVADANKSLFEELPKIKNQLKLITCGGKYDAATQEYDKRVIASARLVN